MIKRAFLPLVGLGLRAVASGAGRKLLSSGVKKGVKMMATPKMSGVAKSVAGSAASSAIGSSIKPSKPDPSI